MDWLDLLAVQGTLKRLLQHHRSKPSILWCSAFFIVQLSYPYISSVPFSCSVVSDSLWLHESQHARPSCPSPILRVYILGSKITVDGDCSHEIKRRLLLGRKVNTNLDSIFKSRDITLPTKVRLVKAMVFPVVMYGCKSWTVKKAESGRIDAFELWC